MTDKIMDKLGNLAAKVMDQQSEIVKLQAELKLIGNPKNGMMDLAGYARLAYDESIERGKEHANSA